MSRKAPVKEIRRLQQMLEAAKLLGSTLDLSELTEITLQVVRRQVPVDRVTAYIVDGKSRMLRSVVAQGLRDFVIRLPIGSGIAGTVAETGETLDIPDVGKDRRFFGGVDRSTGYRTQDIFCLPIRSREGTIIGVLELMNRKRPISKDDTAFLHDISPHIGLALELGWSHREVLEKQKSETELKEMRERLAQVDRVGLMRVLLGNVMHELNNPLAVLLGNVELLKMQLESGAAAEARTGGYIEKVELGAIRSAATLRRFLHVIDTPRRKRRALSLPKLLRQTLAMFDSEWRPAGIEVEDQLRKIPGVVANREEMQDVFLNLLKNAGEAAAQRRKNARITVRSSYDEESQRIRIDITDSGSGIPLKLRPRIFEPFFTTKPKGTGTGLGLMIAQKIVEEHGGRIWFESTKSAGTTFSVELPRGAGKSSHEGSLGSRRLLHLVDASSSTTPSL